MQKMFVNVINYGINLEERNFLTLQTFLTPIILTHLNRIPVQLLLFSGISVLGVSIL